MIDIIIPAKEITEANQQQNAACQAVGGCTSSNISTEGHYAFDDRAQDTNATIGTGSEDGMVTVTIRDTEAQAALEDSGQTAAASEINRDLDTAQVVTRDEHERVDFYLSDSSLEGTAQAVGKTVTAVREILIKVSDTILKAGLLTQEKINVLLATAEGRQQLVEYGITLDRGVLPRVLTRTRPVRLVPGLDGAYEVYDYAADIDIKLNTEPTQKLLDAIHEIAPNFIFPPRTLQGAPEAGYTYDDFLAIRDVYQKLKDGVATGTYELPPPPLLDPDHPDAASLNSQIQNGELSSQELWRNYWNSLQNGLERYSNTPLLSDGRPVPSETLPNTYTRNSDGSIAGPLGGSYLSTGNVDFSGNLIYRDRTGQYYTLNGSRQSSYSPYATDTPLHHVCTNANCVSTARGGPWTPQFRAFFDGAGLDIDNSAENLVRVPGHFGPHPQEYHVYVYDSLRRATAGQIPGTQSYRWAVTERLRIIRRQARTPGHQVNDWLTQRRR